MSETNKIKVMLNIIEIIIINFETMLVFTLISLTGSSKKIIFIILK